MREEALNTAHQALKFLPDDASIHFNIANILGKAGNFIEAEVHFRSAISKNPTDSMYYTNLGKFRSFAELHNACVSFLH